MRVWIAVLLFACGGTDQMPPDSKPLPRVTIRFDYRAPTMADPRIQEQFPECIEIVGMTHIHPSWRQFEAFAFMAEGTDLWTRTFDDVPAGWQRVRVSDQNACDTHRTGAVTDLAVEANGVVLSNLVGTPGSGTEPGFGFTVGEDGSILP